MSPAPPPDTLRFRRASLAATIGAVLLGIALRGATAYPVHKYPADADCLNSGYVALRVLDGRTPAFYTPRRIGALECYLHAAAFRVMGVGRTALAVAPLVSGCLALALYASLVWSLLGPAVAPLAVLLFSIPPHAYLFWTYMPNCYPETLLLCVAAVWCADRARRSPGDWRWIAAFGLVAGLGFWNSIQTLCATLPAGVWLASGGRELRTPRRVGLAMAGFALGALPWIAWNVAVPLGSFRGNFSVRPAAGGSALADNAGYLARYALPELLATVDPENGVNPPGRLLVLLHWPVLVFWAAALLFVFWRAASALVSRERGRRAPAPAETPLLLVALTVCLLAVVSGAGEMRGLTVRYVLPFFLLMPAAAALLVYDLWRRARAAGFAAGILLAAVLVFNVAGYYLPGSAVRRLWEKRRDADADVIAFLEESGVEAVSGDYWLAYPVNFLSGRRITGVPFQMASDFYEIEGTLPDRPLKWAVLAHTRGDLERLVAHSGTGGAFVEVAFESWVFLPETNPETPGSFLSRFRTAFFERS